MLHDVCPDYDEEGRRVSILGVPFREGHGLDPWLVVKFAFEIKEQRRPRRTDCWVGGKMPWKGGEGRERSARIAYRLLKGDIPDGHHVIHTCPNDMCLNPEHLICLPEAEAVRIGARRGLAFASACRWKGHVHRHPPCKRPRWKVRVTGASPDMWKTILTAALFMEPQPQKENAPANPRPPQRRPYRPFGP